MELLFLLLSCALLFLLLAPAALDVLSRGGKNTGI